MIDFSPETKLCTGCNRDLVRYMHFTPSANNCKDCTSKRSAVYRRKTKGHAERSKRPLSIRLRPGVYCG